MARVFRVIPEIEMDSWGLFTFTMGLMLIQMLISLFSYRSLLTTIIVLYSTYISMLYSDEIKDYFKTLLSSFRPVMAPYQSSNNDVIDDDEDDFDEGYEEDDDKQDDEQKTTDSGLRQRPLPRRSLRTTTM
tara:strand:- start:54 stop:446 length:393 start_codon:yes stop_codon:yes gene_type:complete